MSDDDRVDFLLDDLSQTSPRGRSHGTSQFHTNLPTPSNHNGWSSVDDFDALPQRFADTGWGRPSFFQSILNHVDHRLGDGETSHSRPQQSQRPGHSNSSPPQQPLRNNPYLTTSALQVPSTAPNSRSVIDLTTLNDFKPQVEPPMASSDAGPSTKRMRRNNGASQATSSSYSHSIPQIDLSDDEPLKDVRQKQQAAAIKAQEEPVDKPLRMSTLRCVICFESPTNMTVTSCGHWFCHTCIMETLIAGEARVAEGEGRRSQCPICRKNLNRQKAADVFPALIKKGLATQPVKRAGRVVTKT